MEKILEKQRRFYNTNTTKSIAFRKEMLIKLYEGIVKEEKALYEALQKDLNKSKSEAYLTEIQIVLCEIKTALKHIARWQRREKVRTPITNFPAASYCYRDPYGSVLILSPWNFPFQLAAAPLVGAIAGGNCAVVKVSRSSPNVSLVLKKIIENIFLPEYIFCLSDEYSYDEVLQEKYDLIFFTGSPSVGRTVMEAASKHLTPVILELGGKSPCIVDKTANISLAAKRIAWGKFLNAGQTCVAPDYVLIHKSIQEKFTKRLLAEINMLYQEALKNPDYPKIVNRHHFNRLVGLIDREQHKIGGKNNLSALCIEPTIFTNATFEDEIMQEEIFGPILPMIAYEQIDEAIGILKNKEKPLALYLFSKDRKLIQNVMQTVSFGGGCVNDVIMHLANHHLPFGGVGNSGMGSYHGKYSFESFTRKKGVIMGKNILDMPFRYPPYSEKKLKLIRKITGV